MINNISKEFHDILYKIISDSVKTSDMSIGFRGVNFDRGPDLYLIDVIVIKAGTWISDIGGSYGEDCYKVSFSYNHMYYIYTVTHSVYSGYLRDWNLSQVLL